MFFFVLFCFLEIEKKTVVTKQENVRRSFMKYIASIFHCDGIPISRNGTVKNAIPFPGYLLQPALQKCALLIKGSGQLPGRFGDLDIWDQVVFIFWIMDQNPRVGQFL